MSIIRSLKWLVDSIEYREELAQQKRWMEQFPDRDPDKGPRLPNLELKDDQRRYRCRCCGRVQEDGRYCPECLADTMVLTEAQR